MSKRIVVRQRDGSVRRPLRSHATPAARPAASGPANAAGRAAVAGWVCLAVGCALSVLSLGLLWPVSALLLFVAFVLSIVVLAQGDVGLGLGLLFGVLLIPGVVAIVAVLLLGGVAAAFG